MRIWLLVARVAVEECERPVIRGIISTQDWLPPKRIPHRTEVDPGAGYYPLQNPG